MSKPPRNQTIFFWVCFAVCLCLRIGIVLVRADELREDPDTYVQLAKSIVTGHGYSVPGTDIPTAFRPPVYPLLITVFSGEGGHWGRGFLNIVCAALAMICIRHTGRQLGFSETCATFAAAFYGFDPVLLRYTSLSMTETLCSLMSAILLYRLTVPTESRPVTSFLTGMLFGLTVLTRPTYWVFGGLIVLWLIAQRFISATSATLSFRKVLTATLGIALVVTPWLLRNWFVLGSPILMTTHGGYTVFLGNNPAFYAEVVRQPWGTVWDGSHGPGQAAWANAVNQEMDALGLTSEIARDRWMSREAIRSIREDPSTFLQACCLRFLRFYNVVPLGDAASGIPRWAIYLLGGAQSVVWLLTTIGLFKVMRGRLFSWQQWGPVLALILSLTLVHLVYWSNARMRAPVVPAIALLAAAGIDWSRQSSKLIDP